MDSLNYLPEARRKRLLDLLSTRGSLRVSELAQQLGVTPVTIRRDIAELSAQGRVQKIRGGITLPVQQQDSSDRSQGEVNASSPLIGMVVPSLDYYWPEVVRGAEEGAAEANFRFVLRESAYESVETDEAQLRHLLDKHRINGLMVTPNLDGQGAEALFDVLGKWGGPTVFVERRPTDVPVDFSFDAAVSNHALGAALAVQYLKSLGHSKVGLVIGRGGVTGPQVRRGWIDACEKYGMDMHGAVDAHLDRPTASTVDPEVERVVEECLRGGTTALLIHADPEANAIVQYCQNIGVSVPSDLSVIAYDDEVASLFSPALTAVRPPRKSLGVEAASLIKTRMQDRNWPNREVLISPRLNVRESTAVPRGR